MLSVRRCADLFFSAFFVLHIFITICVDAQVVLPAHIYPRLLRSLLSWYISFSGDYLVRDAPPFFKGLVVAELFFQLPLITINAYAFYQGEKWARTTGLIYGVHTATTMVPILADLLHSNVASKSTLMAIYVPYLMIPLALTLHVLTPYSYLQPRSAKAKKRA